MRGRWFGRLLLVVSLGIGFHLMLTSFSARLTGRTPSSKETVRYQDPAAVTKPASSFSDLMPQLVIAPRETEAKTLKPTPRRAPSEISTPSTLAPAVEFWKRIYAIYDSDQVLLHDSEDLSMVYAVLDFRHLSDLNVTAKGKAEIRSNSLEHEMGKLKARLAPEAGKRLRSQTGLKDKFREAVQISGRYLPLFEEIFRTHGVPGELTRLVFVESLFQEKSLSRVGAAGLWQLMPGTGRRYLRVDRFVDERYDPILATHAAAKLLASNYEALDSWPLAVTAYNTGVGQIQKAIRSLGRRDIEVILGRYRSSSFAFASRNFYPAYLAAFSIYENADRYFGGINRLPPLEFDLITLPVRATFPQISFLSDSPLEDLKRLNPAFAKGVWEGGIALPAGYRVRIPRGQKEVFASRFIQYFNPPSDIPPGLAKSE